MGSSSGLTSFANGEPNNGATLNQLSLEPFLEGRRLRRWLHVIPLLEVKAEVPRSVGDVGGHHLKAAVVVTMHVVLTRLMTIRLAHKILRHPRAGAQSSMLG